MKWAIGLAVIALVVVLVAIPWYRKYKANQRGTP